MADAPSTPWTHTSAPAPRKQPGASASHGSGGRPALGPLSAGQQRANDDAMRPAGPRSTLSSGMPLPAAVAAATAATATASPAATGCKRCAALRDDIIQLQADKAKLANRLTDIETDAKSTADAHAREVEALDISTRAAKAALDRMEAQLAAKAAALDDATTQLSESQARERELRERVRVLEEAQAAAAPAQARERHLLEQLAAVQKQFAAASEELKAANARLAAVPTPVESAATASGRRLPTATSPPLPSQAGVARRGVAAAFCSPPNTDDQVKTLAERLARNERLLQDTEMLLESERRRRHELEQLALAGAEAAAQRGEVHAVQQQLDLLRRQHEELRETLHRRDAEVDSMRALRTRQAEEIDSMRARYTRQAEEMDSMRATHTRQTEEMDSMRALRTRQAEEIDSMRATHTRQTEEMASLAAERDAAVAAAAAASAAEAAAAAAAASPARRGREAAGRHDDAPSREGSQRSTLSERCGLGRRSRTSSPSGRQNTTQAQILKILTGGAAVDAVPDTAPAGGPSADDLTRRCHELSAELQAKEKAHYLEVEALETRVDEATNRWLAAIDEGRPQQSRDVFGLQSTVGGTGRRSRSVSPPGYLRQSVRRARQTVDDEVTGMWSPSITPARDPRESRMRVPTGGPGTDAPLRARIAELEEALAGCAVRETELRSVVTQATTRGQARARRSQAHIAMLEAELAAFGRQEAELKACVARAAAVPNDADAAPPTSTDDAAAAGGSLGPGGLRGGEGSGGSSRSRLVSPTFPPSDGGVAATRVPVRTHGTVDEGAPHDADSAPEAMVARKAALADRLMQLAQQVAAAAPRDNERDGADWRAWVATRLREELQVELLDVAHPSGEGIAYAHERAGVDEEDDHDTATVITAQPAESTATGGDTRDFHAQLDAMAADVRGIAEAEECDILRERITALEAELERERVAADVSAAEQQARLDALAAELAELPQVRDNLRALVAERDQLAHTLTDSEADITAVRGALDEATTRMTQLTADLAAAEAARDTAAKETQALIEQIEAHVETYVKREEYDAAKRAKSDAEAAAIAAEERAADHARAVDVAREELARVQARADGERAEDASAHAAAVAALERRLGESDAVLCDAEQRATAAEAARREEAAEAANARRALTAAEGELAGAREEVATLAAERDALIVQCEEAKERCRRVHDAAAVVAAATPPAHDATLSSLSTVSAGDLGPLPPTAALPAQAGARQCRAVSPEPPDGVGGQGRSANAASGDAPGDTSTDGFTMQYVRTGAPARRTLSPAPSPPQDLPGVGPDMAAVPAAGTVSADLQRLVSELHQENAALRQRVAALEAERDVLQAALEAQTVSATQQQAAAMHDADPLAADLESFPSNRHAVDPDVDPMATYDTSAAASLTAHVTRLRSEVCETEAARDAARVEAEDLQARVIALKEDETVLRAEIDAAREMLSRAKATVRAEEAGERVTDLREEQTALQDTIGTLTAKRDAVAAEEAAVRAALDEAQQRMAALREEEDQLSTRVSTLCKAEDERVTEAEWKATCDEYVRDAVAAQETLHSMQSVLEEQAVKVEEQGSELARLRSFNKRLLEESRGSRSTSEYAGLEAALRVCEGERDAAKEQLARLRETIVDDLLALKQRPPAGAGASNPAPPAEPQQHDTAKAVPIPPRETSPPADLDVRGAAAVGVASPEAATAQGATPAAAMPAGGLQAKTIPLPPREASPLSDPESNLPLAQQPPPPTSQAAGPADALYDAAGDASIATGSPTCISPITETVASPAGGGFRDGDSDPAPRDPAPVWDADAASPAVPPRYQPQPHQQSPLQAADFIDVSGGGPADATGAAVAPDAPVMSADVHGASLRLSPPQHAAMPTATTASTHDNDVFDTSYESTLDSATRRAPPAWAGGARGVSLSHRSPRDGGLESSCASDLHTELARGSSTGEGRDAGGRISSGFGRPRDSAPAAVAEGDTLRGSAEWRVPPTRSGGSASGSAVGAIAGASGCSGAHALNNSSFGRGAPEGSGGDADVDNTEAFIAAQLASDSGDRGAGSGSGETFDDDDVIVGGGGGARYRIDSSHAHSQYCEQPGEGPSGRSLPPPPAQERGQMREPQPQHWAVTTSDASAHASTGTSASVPPPAETAEPLSAGVGVGAPRGSTAEPRSRWATTTSADASPDIPHVQSTQSALFTDIASTPAASDPAHALLRRGAPYEASGDYGAAGVAGQEESHSHSHSHATAEPPAQSASTAPQASGDPSASAAASTMRQRGSSMKASSAGSGTPAVPSLRQRARSTGAGAGAPRGRVGLSSTAPPRRAASGSGSSTSPRGESGSSAHGRAPPRRAYSAGAGTGTVPRVGTIVGIRKEESIRSVPSTTSRTSASQSRHVSRLAKTRAAKQQQQQQMVQRMGGSGSGAAPANPVPSPKRRSSSTPHDAVSQQLAAERLSRPPERWRVDDGTPPPPPAAAERVPPTQQQQEFIDRLARPRLRSRGREEPPLEMHAFAHHAGTPPRRRVHSADAAHARRPLSPHDEEVVARLSRSPERRYRDATAAPGRRGTASPVGDNVYVRDAYPREASRSPRVGEADSRRGGSPLPRDRMVVAYLGDRHWASSSPQRQSRRSRSASPPAAAGGNQPRANGYYVEYTPTPPHYDVGISPPHPRVSPLRSRRRVGGPAAEHPADITMMTEPQMAVEVGVSAMGVSPPPQHPPPPGGTGTPPPPPPSVYSGGSPLRTREASPPPVPQHPPPHATASLAMSLGNHTTYTYSRATSAGRDAPYPSYQQQLQRQPMFTATTASPRGWLGDGSGDPSTERPLPQQRHMGRGGGTADDVSSEGAPPVSVSRPSSRAQSAETAASAEERPRGRAPAPEQKNAGAGPRAIPTPQRDALSLSPAVAVDTHTIAATTRAPQKRGSRPAHAHGNGIGPGSAPTPPRRTAGRSEASAVTAASPDPLAPAPQGGRNGVVPPPKIHTAAGVPIPRRASAAGTCDSPDLALSPMSARSNGAGEDLPPLALPPLTPGGRDTVAPSTLDTPHPIYSPKEFIEPEQLADLVAVRQGRGGAMTCAEGFLGGVPVEVVWLDTDEAAMAGGGPPSTANRSARRLPIAALKNIAAAGGRTGDGAVFPVLPILGWTRGPVCLGGPDASGVYAVAERHPQTFTLQQYIRRRRQTMNAFSVGECLHIARKVLGALVVLHDAGVAHRDVTTHQVVLSPDPYVTSLTRVRLRRFGLNEVPSRLEQVSPECLVTKTFTLDNDVYAYGAVLWEMLTYAAVAPLDGQTHAEVRRQVLAAADAGGAIFARPDGCPRALWDGVVARALLPAAHRPSAGELLRTLNEMALRTDVDVPLPAVDP